MRIMLPCQFDMQPRPDQTPRQCLAAARAVVVSWIQRQFRGAGAGELTSDRARISLQGGHEIVADLQECATHQLATIDWQFPETTTTTHLWKFSCAFAADTRAVQVSLIIGYESTTAAITPFVASLRNENPLSTIPEPRKELLNGWRCTIDGQAISTQPRTLRKGRIEDFLDDSFLHPKRVLPILFLLPSRGLRIDEVTLQNLQQNNLACLAQVVLVADERTAEAIGKAFTPNLFPPGCLALLAWAGMTKLRRAHDNRYWTAAQIDEAAAAGGFDKVLQQLIIPVVTERYVEGALIKAARAAVSTKAPELARPDQASADQIARLASESQQACMAHEKLLRDHETSRRHVHALLDNLADLRIQLKALHSAPPQPDRSEERFDELATELDRAWNENQQLRQELETARLQRTELETDFRNYLNSPAAYWEPSEPAATASVVSPLESHEFANVSDALRIAGSEFADALTIWEDAEEAARQSVFAMSGKVYQALRAIAEVTRAYYAARNGGPALGPIDRAFLSRIPFKYTSFESPTTLGLFGADRVFHHRGQSRLMTRHLTLGGGGANTCLQIYFDFDDSSQHAVIGYCGRHLPYSTQRT